MQLENFTLDPVENRFMHSMQKFKNTISSSGI